jgi:DNA helicase HerA-like ATPase
LGSSQSGKSFFVKSLLAGMPRTQRLLIWDPNDEYSKPWTAKKKPLDVDRYESFIDFWEQRALGERRDRAAFAGCRLDEFDALFAYAWCASRCVVVLDEFHLAMRGGSVSPTVEDSIARGRHRGIHFVFVTQNPQYVPTRLYNNAHEIVCFRLNEANAIEKLRSAYGDRAELAQLGSLDVGKCVRINNRSSAS